MEARDLVVFFKPGEECVPVEFLAGLLLDEADAAEYFLHGVVLRVHIVVISQRHAQLIRGQPEIAVLIRARHDTAVAGHVARDEALAEDGVVPLDGNARLRRRQRTHVRRHAVVLDSVEIHRGELLIYHGGEEDGDGLHRQPDEIREAAHQLRRHKLIEADDPLGERLAAADALVGIEHGGDDVYRVLDDDVV